MNPSIRDRVERALMYALLCIAAVLATLATVVVRATLVVILAGAATGCFFAAILVAIARQAGPRDPRSGGQLT